MAQKLSVEIQLNGAEEINRQLEGMSKVGQKAFDDIAKAADNAAGFEGLDLAQVTQDLKKMGITAQEVEKILGAVKAAQNFEALAKGVRKTEAALAAAAVAGRALMSALAVIPALAAAIASSMPAAFANTMKELNRLNAAAEEAGVSIEELSKAENIFKLMGLSAKEAADAAGAFMSKLQKADVSKVKEAADSIDEFGRSSSITALQTLIDNINAVGEAGAIARKKLQELGKLQVSDAAKEIDKINESSASVPDKILKIITVLQKMGDSTERSRLITENFGKEMVPVFRIAGISAEELGRKLGVLPVATQQAADAATRVTLAWNQLANAFSKATSFSPATVESVITSLNQLTGVVNRLAGIFDVISFVNIVTGWRAVWSTLVEVVSTAGSSIATGFQAVLSAITSTASAAVNSILGFFSALPGQIVGFFSGLGSSVWDGLVSGAKAAVDTIMGYFAQLRQSILETLGLAGGGGGGAPQVPGFAGGGRVGGRGTGTSDSNLAWVSRGEHIMPAHAVRQPGVLALLEALRRSGGNLRGVLDRMGHFALGGMVSAPAFARGGPVGGMNHVTIAFPGLPEVGGLRASSAVVDELRRSAALAQVRSGGRKPSRYT